ncbi:MAG: hypothetical protein AAF915_26575 [Cyanobacteria bacterium P01_D01_bin.50]
MGTSTREDFMSSQIAHQFNNLMKKALEEMGWEEEECGFEGEGTFTFVSKLTHEEGWRLKVTYNIEETNIICIAVEMAEGTYIDSLKKGFPNYNEDMDASMMLDGAIEAIEVGMKLFKMENDIEAREVELD